MSQVEMFVAWHMPDAVSSVIAVILGGVSEPAMCGVNFKFKKPLMAATAGNFVGGCVAGL